MSAKLNGHDPWAYLKDALTRLPTHMNSRIEELLPHRWQPLTDAPRPVGLDRNSLSRWRAWPLTLQAQRNQNSPKKITLKVSGF